MRLNERWNI